MSQQAWNQLRDLMELQERMSRLFDHSLERGEGRADGEPAGAADWVPPADIFETKTEFVVKLELPEVSQSDIDVRLDENRLVISGERRLTGEAKREDYHRIERGYGRFARSFTLPDKIDRERIEASYRDGVLRLTLPKREEHRPKSVSIQVK